ncbi:MAG: hypothetical protein ACFFG0_23255 [Candidatus Thorarchaeota archaeon]
MPNKNGDPDLDELTNYEEYLIGTNPIIDNTDQDGYKDEWEVQNGYNPIDPDSHPKPTWWEL